jgi:hypothetical protein
MVVVAVVVAVVIGVVGIVIGVVIGLLLAGRVGLASQEIAAVARQGN